jgi:hypothetical protein
LPRNHALPASALALALSLSLAACAGQDPAPESAPPPSAPAATQPAAPSAAPSSVPSPTPSGKIVEVTYAGGEVTGAPSRVPVKLGERVVLRFTSDVTEEIHVHGYDLYADLVPGQPAEIAFVADLPGSYEVELHDAAKPLYQLRVS